MIPIRIPPPDPEKGWSRGAQLLPGAVVIPPFAAAPVQPTGVYASPIKFIHMSLCFRDDEPFTRPPDYQEPVETVQGLHLWCGILQPHFGHFLCEGVARYWFVTKAPIQSLVFVARRPGKLEEIKGMHRQITALFGVNIPIRVVTQTTRFEHMIVAGPGFGLGRIALGTPEFHAFAKRFGKDIPTGPPGKLYISRSALPLDAGGVLMELILEANLAASGYEIWHPQDHPLEEQISRLKGATEILGLDGSPFHLLGLVGNRDQKIGLILRRNSFDRDNILRQFRGFIGEEPVVIDAVVAHWVPEGHYWARGMLNFGELDFADLREKLVAEGFISADAPWTVPPAKKVGTTVGWLTRKAGRKLVRADRNEDPALLKRRAQAVVDDIGVQEVSVQPTSSSPEKK